MSNNYTGVQVDTLTPAAQPLKDSGQREVMPTGSVRDVQTGKGRYDLLPMHAIERLAQTYEKGAAKYGDDNWRKGQPTRRTASSALRHLCKYVQGHRDEDHLAQAMWNIAAILETQYMISEGLLPPELDDLPRWTRTEKNR
jgi:hypothetical protein